jgi:hypothetical protein
MVTSLGFSPGSNIGSGALVTHSGKYVPRTSFSTCLAIDRRR